MSSRYGWRRALVSVVATVALMTACSRQNPAFLGLRDGGPPPGDVAAGSDANTQDGQASGDAAPIPDGGCQPGSPCVVEGNRCQIGTTSCAGGVGTCDRPAAAPDGAFCGIDKVCRAGSCVDCAAGASCPDPGNECRAGTLDCSMLTGDPVCDRFVAVGNGTPCASGGICYGGVCTTPSCGGTSNPSCDPGLVCDVSGCGLPRPPGLCVGRPATCPTTLAPECGCDGKTYGNDCRRLQAGVALDHRGACVNASEDCLNGVDDNGDGLVDCEDPQCQGAYVCVPTAPTGWLEVGWIAPGGFPACPTTLPKVFDIYDPADLVAPDASCGCECGSPAGVGCLADLICAPGSGCDYPNPTTYPVGPLCSHVTFPALASACRASPPYAAGGSCLAVATKSKPAYGWPAATRGCMRDSAGLCGDAQQRCIPAPPPGTGGPCISRRGDWSCPAAYPSRSVVFDGAVADTRDCATCGCGAPRAASCTCSGGTCGVGVHSSLTCSSGSLGLVPPDGNTCKPFALNTSASVGVLLVGAQVASAGQCDPTPAQATGSVTPTGMITVCCAQ